MPFGAGLLDILNQGGQFMAGRSARKRDVAIEDEERSQQAALQQALLEYRQSQTEHENALTQRNLNPPPDEVNWQLYQDPELGPVQIDPRTGTHRKLEGLTSPTKPATAPVLGTPEYLKAQEDLQAMRNKYETPAGGAGVAGGAGGLPRGMPVGAQAAVISAAGVDDALNRFEAEATKWMARSPVERGASQLGMPLGAEGDAELGNLESLRNEVRLTLKEMANLGVLNGPDMMILDEMIGDPTSVGAVVRDPAYILTRVNRVRDYVKAKKQAYKQAYGVDADALNSSNVGEVFDPQTQIDFLINAGLSDEEIKEELARRGIQ